MACPCNFAHKSNKLPHFPSCMHVDPWIPPSRIPCMMQTTSCYNRRARAVRVQTPYTLRGRENQYNDSCIVWSLSQYTSIMTADHKPKYYWWCECVIDLHIVCKHCKCRCTGWQRLNAPLIDQAAIGFPYYGQGNINIFHYRKFVFALELLPSGIKPSKCCQGYRAASLEGWKSQNEKIQVSS